MKEELLLHNANIILNNFVQHSDIEIQEKYYSMFKDAVNKGDAKACDLALLEDRMELRKGKKSKFMVLKLDIIKKEKNIMSDF